MAENFWDKLSGDDEHAADYMLTYGEGPGCNTRLTLGQFINDGESVLDVGCGPGWNFDHFIEYGPQVRLYVGVDYSERFVRVANQRTGSKYGIEPFIVGDVRKLINSDNTWDVVVMQDVLEHTNGYETFLSMKPCAWRKNGRSSPFGI
jgi:ubiquinone/menaquinone biosynthesis C-methylase UbiE